MQYTFCMDCAWGIIQSHHRTCLSQTRTSRVLPTPGTAGDSARTLLCLFSNVNEDLMLFGIWGILGTYLLFTQKTES